MATLFGRFEVQSQLSKSETALIYKALDTETNQVVALKTQSLEPLGERAAAFVETLIAEGESMRELAGQNIVVLYGAGEIDVQFCAAMEYIQGNSISTMIARKEGFSIWDLLDITRQVCAGLEAAAEKGVTHCSLEPSKIMVQWDGMVKILGYGISNMSLIEAEAGNGLGQLMPYCSPEQIRGEAIDLRSNLFTLGAILYEMVVGHKAFDAADPVALVNQIENDLPASPSAENAKVHLAVSALVMKALAKDPAERYQSARELLDDLEKCKENGKKAVAETKKAASLPNATVSSAARAAAASKFVSAASSAAKPEPSPRPVTPKPVSRGIDAPKFSQSNPPATETMAAAVAASGGSATHVSHGNSEATYGPNSTSGARPMDESETIAPASEAASGPVLSAAVLEQESERRAPRVAIDPVMAESAAGSSGLSFSDLAEMPPLKEPIFAPPPPEPVELLPTVAHISPRKEEKPKVQPREVAEKALKEISSIPPRLMLFSILGALAVILVIALSVYF
ncbi:MAG: serine/threonine protein kinase, partial [Terriglobales bacterium]